MIDFVGRHRELAQLDEELAGVRKTEVHPGRCVIVRGRRRIGKTRLIEEFVERAGVPSLFFTASDISPIQDLHNFYEAVISSDLPDKQDFGALSTWDSALRMLGQILPADQPSIVVIDELPYLTAKVQGFEGSLQTVWDRIMSRKPILLLLVGSDLSIMKSLSNYDRPFHQRGKPMIIEPLTPYDVHKMTKLSAADAFDAYLVTGGLPLICTEWPPKATLATFLATSLKKLTSALVSTGELSLAAEFPPESHARSILPVIASGQSTFTSILHVVGINRMTFTRALNLLVEKGIVAAERPLSARLSKETRYRIADPYLQFWLRFIVDHLGEVQRGRSDLTLLRLQKNWSSWRGRAIEPLVRESLARLLPNRKTPWLAPENVAAIGAYWTRNNSVEVDLVAADRETKAKNLGFVGSIKWGDNTTFSPQDLTELIVARSQLPGTTAHTPLVAVTRGPNHIAGTDATFNAEDLLHAWE